MARRPNERLNELKADARSKLTEFLNKPTAGRKERLQHVIDGYQDDWVSLALLDEDDEPEEVPEAEPEVPEGPTAFAAAA